MIEKLMVNGITKKNISLNIFSNEGLEVHMDPVLIEQVIINLITNSIHALENRVNPKIDLKGYAKEKTIIIEVSDNGKGIPLKELSEIFIPFFTTKKEGSGVGLSLSKQIMSLHEGSLKVQSELNVGTSFYLQFHPHK
jgi:signal transduction histidine kinase